MCMLEFSYHFPYTVQLSAVNLPAQLEDSKLNCLHCDTTSLGLGTFWSNTATHKMVLLSASQARLLQSAVIWLNPVFCTSSSVFPHTVWLVCLLPGIVTWRPILEETLK